MTELKKYTVSLSPMDTLFFRNAVPFSIGEDTWAETSILPNPSVIWGALFSCMLVEKIVTIHQKSNLKIKGLFLQKKASTKNIAKTLIPAPLDLFYEKNNKGLSYSEKYKDATAVISNYPTTLPYLTLPKTYQEDIKIETTNACFITWLDFITNYPKQNNTTRIYKTDYFNQELTKVGISRSNDTRTSEEGKLYRLDMNEYENGWQFVVQFEAPKGFPSTGILKLGGEGKTAVYHVVESNISEPEMLQDEKCWFKLYFQTPAFFESGDGLSELATLKNAKLYSACIGKSVSIGGFDVEKKRPKPMRKAVPAGSVYVFEGNPVKTTLEITQLFQKTDLDNGFGIYHFSKL